MFRRAFSLLRNAAVLASAGFLGIHSLAFSLPEFDEFIELPTTNLVKRNPSNPRSFVIIGSGPAAYVCAYSLRAEGFTGEIRMVSQGESVNSLLFGRGLQGELALGSSEFYSRLGVDLIPGEVSKVDNKNNRVVLKDGSVLQYERLCVATETELKVPKVYHSVYRNLDNVVALSDNKQLWESLSGSERVLIAGVTLKTIELANSILSEYPDKKVLFIDSAKEPLDQVLGPEVSRQVISLLRASGITVILKNSPAEFIEENKKVKTVKIVHFDEFRGKIPEDFEVDLVVLPDYSGPSNSFLPAKLLDSDGAVPVDLYMKSKDARIYAAGATAKTLNVWSEQHSAMTGIDAARTGGCAASNMLGQGTYSISLPLRKVRSFVPIDVVGTPEDSDWHWTQQYNEGDSRSCVLITYFYREDRCVGVVVYNHSGLGTLLRSAIERGLMPSPASLTRGYGILDIQSSLSNN